MSSRIVAFRRMQLLELLERVWVEEVRIWESFSL